LLAILASHLRMLKT